jgi:PAS domain S-box-containing protein
MAAELKNYVAAIEESETRYRILFESAVDAIFIIDTEGERAGCIVAANQAAAKMHGYEVEELQKLCIRDLDIPGDAIVDPDRIARIFRGEWLKMEIDHRRKDGTIFPIEVSAGLLEIKGHKFILAFDRDITARRKTEEKLQRTEHLRMCGEFAASVAHEIKNPLACMKFAIEILSEQSPLPEKDQDVLLKVILEINRIEGLMKDMLNFTRPPKPQMLIMDINKVLTATIFFSQKHPSFSGRGDNEIEIITVIGEDMPLVMADPMQMQQIFLNLLINGAEAIHGKGKIEVRSEYVRSEEMVQITFSDSGHGIEEDMSEKIFDPFFTTKAKGAGMGLAIVKRLVEQHEGSISLQKNKYGETSFIISLPVSQEKVAAA